MQLQYNGFEQVNSVREYVFLCLLQGEETRTFVVSLDLALFRKHRVGIQEGPVLCLRKLQRDLEEAENTRGARLSRVTFSEKDMLAYVASRVAPKPRKPARRPKPARAAAAG